MGDEMQANHRDDDHDVVWWGFEDREIDKHRLSSTQLESVVAIAAAVELEEKWVLLFSMCTLLVAFSILFHDDSGSSCAEDHDGKKREK